MEEFNAERKSSELSKEEVSIYTNDCGVTRYNCVTDCFGVLGPVLICIFGYTGLYHVMNGMFFSDMMSMLKPYPFVLCTSGGILLIGMVVGMLGSYLAVRKYLRWTR